MTTNTSQTFSLPVIGLKGSREAARLTRDLGAIEGMTDISVDLKSDRIKFRLDAAAGANGQIQRAVEAVKKVGLSIPIRQEEVDIFNLRCAACVATLENGLKQIPGIFDARINFATQTGRIDLIDGIYDRNRLIEDIRKIGYEAGFHVEEVDHSARARRLKRDLVISLASTAAIFVMHFGQHVLHLFTIRPLLSVTIQFLLTLPVLYAGRIFFVDAFRQLRHGRANMNSLVALGSGTAFVYSLIVSIRLVLAVAGGHTAVYYETTAMILAFILVGKYLEEKATQEARDAAVGISSLIPRQITRLSPGGEEEEIAVEDLRVSDTVIVRPGGSFPADGVILAGETSVDESMITGESMPVSRTVGDPVTGGTVNISKGVTFTVSRVGSGTVLARMIRMVRDAQGDKAPIQRTADRVAAVFVPIVIAVAAVTLAVWAIAAPGSAMILTAPVAVLLVACPCAMGLATPTAILVGTGRAARLGVFFRNGEILEKLTRINTFVFDKTGTLTDGRPVIDQVKPYGGAEATDLLLYAASAEQYSEHPFASAVRGRARREGLRLLPLKNHENVPGHGIIADVGGQRVALGNRALIAEAVLDADQMAAVREMEKNETTGIVHIAVDGKYLGAITLSDSLKNGAAETIGALTRMGYETIMLTGDNRFAAASVAAKLGLSRVEAEAVPETKLLTIRSLRQTGRRTVMVGDGVNDAAALTAADIGISLGTGTDIAIKASDITITGRSLQGILTAIEASRATLKTIKQNLFWAFFYNIVMIPVAAGLFYPIAGIRFSPVMAAAAMALSSIFVVTNSLRLKKLTPTTAVSIDQ